MKIGITGVGGSIDQLVGQAKRAEEDGFSSLWYTSPVQGDPDRKSVV